MPGQVVRVHGPSIDGLQALLEVRLPRGRRPVVGAVLLLHGGRSTSLAPTRAGQLAVLRMVPFARAVQQTAGRAHLPIAVARLRYRVRGWNGRRRDPVVDARWALGWLRAEFGAVPLGLIGHSMGGRAAMAVAGEPGVGAVVGLAPWLGADDRVGDLGGRRILIVHGTADRMTDPSTSRDWADRARRRATAVTYIAVPNASHAMLRSAGLFQQLAAGFVVGLITPDPRPPSDAIEQQDVGATGTDGARVAKLLPGALAGVPYAQA